MNAKKSGLRSTATAWPATLAGLSATLVGIGLARFAYTPLIPALIDAEWFRPSDVVYLGAANLAGYLAGALLARPLARWSSAPAALKTMMVLATVSLFACASPVAFAWFFLWRLSSGLAGGVLMVLAAPTVLPQVAPARQGLAAGIVFTGVGLGIAASGTLVPWLLRFGLPETWVGLGAVALALTLVTWRAWPEATQAAAPEASGPRSRARSTLALKGLYLEYALCAAGLVPHMVFLVDFVVRGLGRAHDLASGYWVLFGIGAMLGPVLAGRLGDRIGFRTALRLAYVIQAVGTGWLALSSQTAALAISSLVMGAFVPGIVALVLGRAGELAGGPKRQQLAWSRATIAFALGQAGAAYGFSYLFDLGGSYLPLFALGAGAFVVALAINIGAARLEGNV